MPAIPKTLQFIWMGKDLPRKYVRNIAFWAKRNPDYAVNIWTNHAMRIHHAMTMNDDIPSFPHTVRDIKEITLQRAYKAIVAREMNGPFNNYASASDVLRLGILHEEGGVYIDTDAECTRSATIQGIVFTPRLGTLRSHRGFLVAQGTPANYSIPQNAVLASVAGNRYVRRILRAIGGYYAGGFIDPDDAWEAKRVPAKADAPNASRRLLTIAMSGPSVVEEVLKANHLVDAQRVVDAQIRFPMDRVKVPCDRNWLGIGRYRHAEY